MLSKQWKLFTIPIIISNINQVSIIPNSNYERNIKFWCVLPCVNLLHYEADILRRTIRRFEKIDWKRIRTYRGDGVDLKCDSDEKFLAAVEECNTGSHLEFAPGIFPPINGEADDRFRESNVEHPWMILPFPYYTAPAARELRERF